ncbi:exodeoxyribonuclease VII large subunit [Caldicellulosiruptoraceae bacterium PP1]
MNFSFFEDTQDIWTVNQLTTYIKDKIDRDYLLKDIIIRGEIVKPTISGKHLYFDLKDTSGESKIKCVFFGYLYTENKLILPSNGFKALLYCDVMYYDKDNVVELRVKKIQEEGFGELYLKLKELREKLEKEGLFDDRFKKPLPSYPKSIGIVTSKYGAAVLDIINSIKNRFSNIHIYIYNCQVQGQNAPKEICEGINYFDNFKKVDIIIVGRGGGSFEDLMAFNDEQVIRTIFAAKTPIISAVGHDRDYVLSDYVADVRAITPTNAGEIVVKKLVNLQSDIENLTNQIKFKFNNMFQHKKKDLLLLERLLEQNSPQNSIYRKMQYVDTLTVRLNALSKRMFLSKKERLNQLEKKLNMHSPVAKFNVYKNNYFYLNNQLPKSMKNILNNKTEKIQNIIDKLIILNPLNILRRGYTVTKKDDKIVTDIEKININDIITVMYYNGNATTKIIDIKKEH